MRTARAVARKRGGHTLLPTLILQLARHHVDAFRTAGRVQLGVPALALAQLRSVDAFPLAFRVHCVGLGDAFVAAFLGLEWVAFALALGRCLSADAFAIKEILVLCKGYTGIKHFCLVFAI